VLIRLSQCCTPVPGDQIIGFVTRGRGVSVHRADCANAISLQEGPAERLIEVTYDAMMRGIAVVKPGLHIGAIGNAIQRYAESHRFSVVRDFCGHGVGRVFHDAPSVLHYGRPEEGPVMREGMFCTIEPMINAGRYEVKILSDGWTAVTRDR